MAQTVHHLHFSGFSESRAVVELGAAPALRCNSSAELWQQGDWCKGDPRWRGEHNASFLATCRETTPRAEARCANGVLLSYSWKSFAFSERDLEVAAYLRASAESGARVAAVFAVGPHHFATEAGHAHHQYQAADRWMPPQEWTDRYVRGLQFLFARLARLRAEAGWCLRAVVDERHRQTAARRAAPPVGRRRLA